MVMDKRPLSGIQILPESIYTPITIFVLAPGAFFVLSFLTALQNKVKMKKGKKITECGADCASCGNKSCAGHFFNMTGDPSVSIEEAAKTAEKKTTDSANKE